MEAREVCYEENETLHKGWCHLISGGVYSHAFAVIEREDGTLTEVLIENVQFNDRIYEQTKTGNLDTPF